MEKPRRPAAGLRPHPPAHNKKISNWSETGHLNPIGGSGLRRQKPGRPAARPGARHQSGSDDIGEDHRVDAAGVRVIDVPRTVAQQDVGKDVHDLVAENKA